METTQLDGELKEVICATIDRVPVDFGGGSTALKSLVVGQLIVQFDLETVVELGVYRGRFFLPQAALMQHLGRGRVIGVDPYRADAARQRDWWRFPKAARKVNQWVDAQDFDEIHDEVERTREELGLMAHSELWRMTSAEASRKLLDSSVDVVHIDGNHDRRAVERDLAAYLPKLRPRGIVVFDDASWRTIRPVVRRFAKGRRVLHSISDGADDFVIVQLP